MDYEKLKEVIAKQIKENGRREITGPVLQAVLMAMVDSLGEVYPHTYTDEEKAQARANIDALSDYDGEITKEKLSLEVQAILNDVANKQNITDASLATIAKTIVGAINEVYKGGLKDASIATSKIEDGAITDAKIASGAVTTPKIANDAVTTEKLKDGAITEPKLDTDLLNVINSAVQPAELASALASYVPKADIVSTTGSATDKVMSQHGVTEAINGVTNKVTELESKNSQLGQEVSQLQQRILPLYKNVYPKDTGGSAGTVDIVSGLSFIANHKYKFTVVAPAKASDLKITTNENVVIQSISTNVLIGTNTYYYTPNVDLINVKLRAYYEGSALNNHFDYSVEDYTNVSFFEQLEQERNSIALLQKNQPFGYSVYKDYVSGAYVQSGDTITTIASDTTKRAQITVKKGDFIYLQNKGGVDARGWYLTNSNNVIVRESDVNVDYTTAPFILEVEDGETKLYVNAKEVDGAYGDVVIYDKTTLPLFALGSQVKTPEIAFGYYSDNNGVISFNTHTTIKCGFLKCKKGDFIYLQNKGGVGNARAYYVTDSSGNILEKCGTVFYDFFENPEILEITQSNAAYIYFNSYPVMGNFGLIYLQDPKNGFMSQYSVAKNLSGSRIETKFNLMYGYGLGFVQDGAFLQSPGNLSTYIQMNTPITNPLLLSITAKTDTVGTIFVQYVSDVETNFQTQVNQLLGYYYINKTDYDCYEFLLPPFLFASGRINISFNSHITIKNISVKESLTKTKSKNGILFASHLGYMLGYNTTPGFKMAAVVGFSSCVANLRKTADDVMVCAHDDKFIASSDGNTYYISQKTYAQITELGYQENGNGNARLYTGAQHLVKVDEFLKICATTGMKPIFSAKEDVDYSALLALLKKYGFNNKDDVEYKAFSMSLIESAYNGLGDNICYGIVLENNSSLDSNLQAWANLNLGNAHKFVELFRKQEYTQTDVEKCINAGFPVSIFDDLNRDNSFYRNWIDWGVTKFTTNNMISDGYGWI